jgi:HAD superfamily hydrolase (TIGR01509 family)
MTSTPHLPEAILFDFDGVLASSHVHHGRAWRTSYQELRGEPLDIQELIALSGLSPRRIASALALPHGIDAEALYARKQALMMQAIPELPLLDGARDLLIYLRDINLPHGIASNSPRELVQGVLDQHGVQVEHVLGLEDYTHPKPDPEAYLKLGRALGVREMSRAWVVEDSSPGLKAAVASGAGVVVGMHSHAHDAESLRLHGAHLTMTHPGALLTHLRSRHNVQDPK